MRDDDRLARRIAARLVARDGPWDRFLAYEMLNAHPTAAGRLTGAAVARLGRGIDSWGDVDMFACFELAKRDPAAVRAFLTHNDDRVAASVRREVTTKLDTGVKARRARPRA